MVHPHIGATNVGPLVAQGRVLAVWPHHPLCWLSCLCLLSGAKISNKALTQKVSRIFNVVTSFCNISLNHFANHLVYLSTASSFWFSLNLSYDHDFHVYKRLGMSPQDYEYLIKMIRLKLFLEGHCFMTINCDGTFEVDEKKVDLNAFIQGESSMHRERVYFVRIGILHDNFPRKIEMQKDTDSRMIVTPPRLNEIWIKQQSFRQ
jgi:hypothetical protein